MVIISNTAYRGLYGNYVKYWTKHSKCLKILYIKVSDKMTYANSAVVDQTASEEAVWSGYTLFAIPPLGTIWRKKYIKSKI